MSGSIYVLKGNIIYSKNTTELTIIENGYLVCENGVSQGVYRTLPSGYQDIPLRDYGDALIIPGLIDLHTHAPQYSFRGLGMDMELIGWLEANTFPEEAKFRDMEYAKSAYAIFVDNLRKSPTTRACVFATTHRPATLMLMEMLEEAGLITLVGKVNMDRNCPDYLKESSPEESAEETERWLEEAALRDFRYTKPILTPRFTPCCTDDVMRYLKKLQVKHSLSLQSHLSENSGEIAWVKELCPWSEFYGDVYDQFGLFGRDCKTIMAHCVLSDDREIMRMKENGVYVAHCPESNMNLSSGVAPVRKFLETGVKVGLGSDVAGGSSENMFSSMARAIQASKMRWKLHDSSQKPLTAEEVFYMATMGGGEFFGKVGSFEAGYEFDAVVLDDSRLKHPQPLDLKQRLERLIYLSDDREIVTKYAGGREVSLI